MATDDAYGDAPDDATLAFHPIDERSWRLCDPRWQPNDAAYVVAYIEQIDAAFDVVWMRGSRRRSRLASLEECAREGRSLMAQEIAPGTRPVRIPHFPPPRLA